MQKSVDKMNNQNNFKYFISPDDLEEIVDKDKEKDNTDYNALIRLNTSNSLSSNKENTIIYNTFNPSMRRSKKKIKKEIDEEKKIDNNYQRKNIIKFKRNKGIKAIRNKKGSFSKLFDTNKIIYIKKRNSEKKENNDIKVCKTVENEDSQDNESESKEKEKEKEIINEIKDSVICYICLLKIEKPRICPNCHKIACEKCLKSWFDKGNNSCGYCRASLTFDKMISVPIINDVANLIDKISSKSKTKKIPNCYTKRSMNKYGLKTDIIKEKIFEFNDDDFKRNFVNLDYFKSISKNKQLSYLNKNKGYMNHSTQNSNKSSDTLEIHNKNKNLSFGINEEFCQKHPDQPLNYYCLDCEHAYCRTCFVFFGEEKDKHNEHNIIEYNKYKSMNIPEMIKNSKYLDDKYEEIEAYIKRCEALKNCYEFERNLVLEQVREFMNKFNNKIDENIKKLDDIVETYSSYLIQINKCKNDVNQYYITQKYNPDLVEKLNNIKTLKYLNSKEIDNFCDLTKNMEFKVYQTDFKKYEIKENSYHFKIPLNNSKYQLAINKKRNEVQIYIYWKEDNDINEDRDKYTNLLPIIFMRKKNKNWECFQLNEFLNYKGNNYYIKRFSANNFCGPNSYFKIKGILYENYIE